MLQTTVLKTSLRWVAYVSRTPFSFSLNPCTEKTGRWERRVGFLLILTGARISAHDTGVAWDVASLNCLEDSYLLQGSQFRPLRRMERISKESKAEKLDSLCDTDSMIPPSSSRYGDIPRNISCRSLYFSLREIGRSLRTEKCFTAMFSSIKDAYFPATVWTDNCPSHRPECP